MIEKKRSIRYKLSRVILITSASVLLLTFAFFFLYEYFSYRQLTVRQLSTLSNIIASNSTAALAFKSQDEADEILSALKVGENITEACIYNEYGQLFSVYPHNQASKDFPLKPGAAGFTFSNNSIEGFVPIILDGQPLGTLFIRRNLDDLRERLALYSIIVLLVLGVSLLLVYLLSKKLQEGISLPIIALSETTKQVSLDRNYSIRAQKISDDEIGSLTDDFNTMLSQIEIQNKEIEAAREAAHRHAQQLEVKVNERTIEYKKQKDFAEVVVNSSLVLITVFDLDMRILAFNKKCEEEFHVKQEMVLGRKYTEVFPGVKDTLTYESILRSLQGEIIYNPQYQSGVTGHFYESYSVPLRNENGDVYAVLMTAHNITQVVETAEKMRNSNTELQQKNEELEQFAYVASHDLQEPLRKIRTFIDLIKVSQYDRAVTEKYVNKAAHAAERMTMLIHDVLDYSRVSRVQESHVDVDLNHVLENVKSDLELLIAQRGAEIRHDVLPIIKGNELQLHQLFSNLINNSIKFCDGKPEIKIKAMSLKKGDAGIEHELNPNLTYVQLLFNDNGIGFPQEYAAKVFTIFQRLHTRDKYEGTGIGLALCKRIVQNHNGFISVTSVVGQGTTFSVLLPQA